MELDDLKTQYKLVTRLGLALEKHQLSLTTAESCTGGSLAHVLTSIPTSSSWFERGFVTYSEASKISMLEVKKETLNKYGAVSKNTAIEMAEGALKNSLAHLSLSVTGIAGPQGERGVPIGTCWFGWASSKFATYCDKGIFTGDRTYINYQAVQFAISRLLEILSEEFGSNTR